MNFSNGDLLTVNDILSDVLSIVDDGGTKLRSKGWYIGQIKQALEELNFDTFFGEFHGEYALPSNLQMQIPTGAFNINDVFGIGGDGCAITGSHKIWHKRGFINSKSGNGFTARNNGDNDGDPFHSKSNLGRRALENERLAASNLYYYSIHNGIIMFSESCRVFGNIRLVFNGVADDVAGEPLIPKYLRQAVKDWVSIEALRIKALSKVGTQEYSHWVRMLDKATYSKDNPRDGSWIKAERRVKKIDRGQKRDMDEYFKSLNY
jgi:hypothetical protein